MGDNIMLNFAIKTNINEEQRTFLKVDDSMIQINLQNDMRQHLDKVFISISLFYFVICLCYKEVLNCF